jgi:hypothetical protein
VSAKADVFPFKVVQTHQRRQSAAAETTTDTGAPHNPALPQENENVVDAFGLCVCTVRH